MDELASASTEMLGRPMRKRASKKATIIEGISGVTSPPEHVPFLHKLYPHVAQNVNNLHKDEHENANLNTRIAVKLTKVVSTMDTAYSFALLALIGLLAIIGIFPPVVALLVVWFSQTFLQLVFLPILSVGQSTLSRHAELMAEEQFQTTNKTYHDLMQVMKHLDSQDVQILGLQQQIFTLIRQLEAK